MPKIIADIENKILSTAETLFHAQGYEDTDMRQIALQTGIAVGSIYKYFEDKHDLYLQVLSTSWLSTIRDLEVISKQDLLPEVLLTEMLALLSAQISSRQIWTEISVMFAANQANQADSSHFGGLHHKFSAAFSQVITQMLPPDQESSELANQLGSFAFVMVADLSHLPAEQAVEQSKLIADLLISYLAAKSPENTS